MTWTHNGATIGPKPRPWRLTRRQRVEMNGALALMRAQVLGRVIMSSEIGTARFLAGVPVQVGIEWRILRARVAIALRAALRADEDARCEEVHARDEFGDWPSSAIDATREWPPMRRPTETRWVDSWAEVGALRTAGTLVAVLDQEGEARRVVTSLPIPLALWERAS